MACAEAMCAEAVCAAAEPGREAPGRALAVPRPAPHGAGVPRRAHARPERQRERAELCGRRVDPDPVREGVHACRRPRLRRHSLVVGVWLRADTTRTHRSSFKEHADADAVAAAKLIAAGQKELKALRALLGNEYIKRYPGPAVCPRLHAHARDCRPARLDLRALVSRRVFADCNAAALARCSQMIAKLHQKSD